MVTKQTEMILDLIKQGKTASQIAQQLNITHQQLYVRLTNLQNKGFLFKRTYYSNGEIGYRGCRNINSFLENSNKCAIITKHDEETIQTLILSDLHFGNELDRLDLLDRVFNFCIKNNIHCILGCGDFIDGTFSRGEQKIADAYSQIEYFIKNYPHDDGIFTFGVGGDHDISTLNHSMQDFNTIINNYRHDIKISSYNNVLVNIKNSGIILHHQVPKGCYMSSDIAPIVFNGHYHNYIIRQQNSKVFVNVPSLSDINESMPSAVLAEFQFQKGFMSQVILKQVIFSDKDNIVNENIISIPNNFETKPIAFENYDAIQVAENENDDILNVDKETYDFSLEEEIMIDEPSNGFESESTQSLSIESKLVIEEQGQNKDDELSLKRAPHVMSQIEKFNQRYHL